MAERHRCRPRRRAPRRRDEAKHLLERDDFSSNRHPALSFCLSMIFSENRYPPIGSWPEGMLFRIMLWKSSCSIRPSRRWRSHSCSIQLAGPPIAYLPSPNSLPAQDSPVTRHRFSFAVWLLAGFMLAGTANVFAMPSPIEAEDAPGTLRATSAATRLSQAQPAPAPQTPAAPAADPATDAQAPSAEPIGNVATLTGIATVIRKKDSIALKLKDDIFQNDVLQTSANSTLGVTFNDATTFNLTANARITVDSYVYEDGGKQNAALFDIAKGTVAFVAAAVAK